MTIWRLTKTGVAAYQWQTEDGRGIVHSRVAGITYLAMVDGRYVGKRYRTKEAAMLAAAKAIAKAEAT